MDLFMSYVRDCGFAGEPNRERSPSERAALESLFDDYLVVGGFPAVQGDGASTHVEVPQGYVRDVAARDVAERLVRAGIPRGRHGTDGPVQCEETREAPHKVTLLGLAANDVHGEQASHRATDEAESL